MAIESVVLVHEDEEETCLAVASRAMLEVPDDLWQA